MRTKTICFLLMICSSLTFSQINSNVGEIVKEFQKSSVSFEIIEKSQDIDKIKPILVGSGFIVIKKNRTFAITNAHVKNAVKTGFIMIIGMNTSQGKVYGIVNFLTENLSKDIAIYEYFGYVFSNNPIVDSTKLNQNFIGVSYFAKVDEIITGNSVISIGYPLNIGSDNFENNPVVRSGIVAQKVQKNGMFLIDGMSNPGNSGSPVFDINQTKLLGMISSLPNDRISLFDENGNLIAFLPYNSGLTICIPAGDILKIIP